MAHTGQHENECTARGEAPAGAAAVAAAVDAAEAVLDPLADWHLVDRAPLSATGLALNVRVILTYPCIFYMDNH